MNKANGICDVYMLKSYNMLIQAV